MNKSFLKWAGGKFSLLPTLIPIVQSCTGKGGRYIEPFVGGGALALNIPSGLPKVINDTNPGVVAVWQTLQDRGADFIEDVNPYFRGENTEKAFYTIRNTFNRSLKDNGDVRLRAMYFLYLNRHCFNGLCRFNKKGEFNVPYGRYKSIYFPEKELLHAIEVMKNTQIHQNDFRAVMATATQGDVVYCDPPYIPLGVTSSFVGYSKEGFGIDDQMDLMLLAEAARNRGATVIISNNDVPLARKLYDGASEIHSVQVAKRISCKGDGRKKSGEIIAVYRP